MGSEYPRLERRCGRLRRKRSKKCRIPIGGLGVAAVAIALFVVFSSPIAMEDPAFHRGLQHPALRLFGERYEVAYICPPGASRLGASAHGALVQLPSEGTRYYHYLAWNHDDAIRFSASIEPACRIARLVHVRRRWFRRYPDRNPVVGPAEA